MLVEVEIEVRRILRSVKPARGIKPEDGFVAVGAELIDDVLRCVFELPEERAHDEDWNRGWGRARGKTGVAKAFAVYKRRVLGVGEGADSFDEGDVSFFEAGGEVKEGFVVGGAMDSE